MSHRFSAGQLALRAVVLLGPLVALLATGPTGAWPGVWLVALTGLLAAGFAAAPESALGTSALCLVVIWWGIAVEGVHAIVVLAGAALLAGHLAALLLAYGPAGLPLDRRVLWRWVRRGLLVGLAAPGVWLVARVLEGQPEPPGIWVAGLAAGIAVCVVAATVVGEREPG